ncbi:hypothetical protein GCM10009654_47120 [Streptomyces hebeiensis]|uniref:Uncharacterized protein n=1 Tax=Streptomyces hebeiensis TaxID=229486 RepID=A0ABP4FJB2_9ACTN
MFRQGDVLITPVAQETVPARLLDETGVRGEPRDARGRLVLALGEVTGHAHAVPGPGRLIRESGDMSAPMYLHLPDGGRVVHEEHAAIALPKGWFRVVRQREYVPGAFRVVAD